jgi:hypothetical protein
MENSNVLYFPVKKTEVCDFDLMHNLLRYVYDTRKATVAVEKTDVQERTALQQTYYCRAALKRRLKQVAMREHELKN